MNRTQRNMPETIRRMLALACLVPLLLVGTTACTTPTDDVAGQSAPSGDDAGSGDDAPNTEPLESLGSAALLELGMTGGAAVKCDFTYGDSIGTMYFNGPDRQRFDSLNEDRAKVHIVMYEGQAHTWRHGESEGVRFPKDDEYAGIGGESPEDVKAHSTNCVPHSDLSIFELPADVTFVDPSRE